jgi:hypothetical protein
LFSKNTGKKLNQKAEETPVKLYYDYDGELTNTPRSGRQSLFKNNIQLNVSTEEKENLSQKEKRKLQKKRRKEFIANERRSHRREHRRMKQQIATMRKKINADRMEELRKEFGKFIRHPLRTREIDETDKRIRKKIERDIRRQNLQNFNHIPILVIHSISRFWKHRFKEIKNIGRNLRSFIHLSKVTFNARALRFDHIKTMINSLAFFLLSFLLVYYVHQFATILTARAFNIPTKLYSYRIDWPLYTYSYLYTRKALIVIFGTGPLVCLLLGIGSYRLFLWARFRTVFLKTLALWTAFNAFNLFFGAYVVGVITRTGFVYTSEWLFLSNIFDVEEIVLMIVSLVVLLIAGYYATKQFLYASNSAAIIEPKIRIIYIFTSVFIPWLAGNMVLYAVNIPKNPVELILLYSTSALIVIPIFSNYNTTTMQMVRLPWTPRKFRIGWAYLLITVMIIFATRFLLKSGISFY